MSRSARASKSRVSDQYPAPTTSAVFTAIRRAALRTAFGPRLSRKRANLPNAMRDLPKIQLNRKGASFNDFLYYRFNNTRHVE